MAKYECIFENAGVVDRYGRLRHIPDSALLSIGNLACRLGIDAAPSGDVIRIADAGAGTGRFALPCAEASRKLGADIELAAIDLSGRILKRLHEKWPSQTSAAQLRCVQADLQEPLPIPSASAHVVYTVATFHILDRWRAALDNLVKMSVPGGFLIFIRENNQFMHETEGFERNVDFPAIDPLLKAFMTHYHEQREANGEPYIQSELRYSDMMPAIHHLRWCGLREIDHGIPASQLSWDKPHTYGDILHCFRNRQMTTWGTDLSEPAREKIANALDAWVSSHKIDPDHEFVLPACLVPHVFQKPKID